MNKNVSALFCHEDGGKEYVTVMLKNGKADVFGFTEHKSGEDEDDLALRSFKNVYNDSGKMFKVREPDDISKIMKNNEKIVVKLTGNPNSVTYKNCGLLYFSDNLVFMFNESVNLVNAKNMAAAQNIPTLNLPNTSALSISKDKLNERLNDSKIQADLAKGRPLKIGKYEATGRLKEALHQYAGVTLGTTPSP